MTRCSSKRITATIRPSNSKNSRPFIRPRESCSKQSQGDELFLYYGNPQVAPPSYDLSLVAEQLLTAEKNVASISAEQQLKESSWYNNQMASQGGVLLWGILALVVVVLLFIISRLLPNSQPPAS